MSDTNLHSNGRPSLWPGTPGGGEESHPTRKRVPGGYPEGIRLKANWYRAGWLLPPLAVLWSNLHGIEYLVMLLVLGVYFVGYMYKRMRKKDSPHDTYLYPRLLTLYAAGVICTPHGIMLLAVPFKSTAQVPPGLAPRGPALC